MIWCGLEREMNGKQPSVPHQGIICTRSCPMVYHAHLPCFINDILRDFLEKLMVSYIDEILIYSPVLKVTLIMSSMYLPSYVKIS